MVNNDDISSSSFDSEVKRVILPAHVIGRSIGSFLDRQSLNALRLTSREVFQSMNGMYRPWPNARLFVGKKLGIQSIAFNSDGSSMACRSRGGTIQLWNRHDGKQIEWTSRAPFCFGNLVFSPDDQVLACDGGSKSVKLYEASSGNCLQSLRGHQGGITSICFSCSDKYLVASASTDSTIRLWNRIRGEEQAVLHGHFGAIYSIAISPDGNFLVSGGTDRILRVWDLDHVLKNKPYDFCSELKGHNMTIVEVAFSDQFIASASLDMTVRLWSRTRRDGSREPKRRAGQLSFVCQQVLRLEWEALTMKFSPDGRMLAVGMSNETISIWKLDDVEASDEEDLKSPAPFSTIPGKRFSFAPKTITMATSCRDGFIQLQDVRC